MSLTPGVRALAVGIAAEVTGTTASPDHAIAIAVIAAAGTIVTVLMQATISDWLRSRRTNKAGPVDEQAELNQLLIHEMHRLTGENERLTEDNERLRRRRT
jgi:hypothetical protein